jgi:CRISPR system Cascade subunit CasA
LAIIYRVYGGPRTSGLVENTWADLYAAGRFDERRIQDYLTTWRHRFDLFDPERPFYQVPIITAPDGNPVSRTSIALLEFDRSSGNNPTLFDHSTDDVPIGRTPAEAAGILLVYQAFSAGGRINNEQQSKKSGLLRGGVQLFVQGVNLWQTLVLNLLDGDPYPVTRRPDLPTWEQESIVTSITRQPGGWLDALTWQSRRVVLHPEVIDGVTLVREVTSAGGHDPVDDSLVDPHVRRRLDSTGKKLIPLKLDPDKALWRNAAALYGLHERVASQGPLRTTVIEQIRDRWNDDDDGSSTSVGQRLRAIGMATDKSKVLMWRDEMLPLPDRILSDPILIDAVQTGLDAAEQAWGGGVRRALKEVARVTLAPMVDAKSGDQSGRGGKNLDDDARKLTTTTAAESTYWAILDAAFPSWIDGLDRASADANDLWRETIVRAARSAFEAGCRGLGESPRAWKGAAIARRRLESGLAESIQYLLPQEDTRA